MSSVFERDAESATILGIGLLTGASAAGLNSGAGDLVLIVGALVSIIGIIGMALLRSSAIAPTTDGESL